MNKEHMGKPVKESVKEYARGIIGGLLFSLPMLYTMEMWWAGFMANPLRLLTYFLVGLLLLLAYNQYVGIHGGHSFIEGIIESIEEMGMGLLVTAFILWITGRILPGMSMSEISGKMVVEGVTVAIGISVGKTQLGNNEGEEEEKRAPHLQREIGLAICGAILIASNVAPTEEVIVIALETVNYQLLIMCLISIGIGALVLYYINFKGSKKGVVPPQSKSDVLAGVLIMYAIALASSGFMLWFFGRFEGLALHAMVAETVVLSFPATLGASAGRLLIQS